MRTSALLAGALAATVLPAQAAFTHQGNPKFSSEITGLDPATPGIEIEVLNFDDSLRLTNRSQQTVVVEGYEDEPYVRIAPDGMVDVNRRSPAYYLNEDRFAEAPVPASADPDAPPAWREVDRTGQYSWHDHRAHYMGEGTPPQVDDESSRTKVFDYEVPLEVGGEPAAARGTLTWVGDDDEFPLAPFIGLAGALLLGLIAVGALRRRRRAQDRGEVAEAW